MRERYMGDTYRRELELGTGVKWNRGEKMGDEM